MSTARNAFLIAVLLLAPFLIVARDTAGQPMYASPLGYIHDIPYFAINHFPGEVVEVGIWLELLRSEPTTTIRYDGEFGTIIVTSTATVSGPSFNRVVETLTAEAIMAECENGWIQVNERILQQDTAGGFSIPLHKRENLAPCGWASSNVTPVAPTQREQCGDDNDTLQIGRQVPGLIWDEGVWTGNSRTVTFTADPGYTLTGQSTFTFVDSGSCTVGPAIAPVRTYVCGANNDRLTLQQQPPEITLVSDSGWIRNQRIVRYGIEHTYTLDGSGEFRFTDDPNLLCPSPIRTPPMVVLTPRATFPPIDIRPTPRPGLVPRVTIAPTPTHPDTWTPTDTPPGWTPTPPIWNPIPIRPTPRGFPMPRATFGPLSPRVTPTPVTKLTVPEQKSGSAGPAVSAVMVLTPAAVVLGAIAASRRHDE